MSNADVTTVLEQRNLQEFEHWLAENDFYIFTMNGFPYGSFHRREIKDDVHKPDWTDKARVQYTKHLFRVLSHVLPAGIEGGVSTSPLSYKPWLNGDESLLNFTFEVATQHILTLVPGLYRYKTEAGKLMHLDIEPEPDGLLENTQEVLEYFSRWLVPMGIPYVAKRLSMSHDAAEEIIREHIRICYDVCHFAIEYEDPQTVFDRLNDANIKIGKIQISAALKTKISANIDERSDILELLESFNESTYLHQVIEKNDTNQLIRYTDLPLALENFHTPGNKEWRLHFHIPIFQNRYRKLHSTQEDILKVLEILKNNPVANHLEVETYTWEVLPEDLKLDLSSSIQRELEWVLKKLGSECPVS